MRLTKEELDGLLKRNPDLKLDYQITREGKTPHFKSDDEWLESVKKIRQQPVRSKYGATRTEYNGITYDSKREAEYAQYLDFSVKAGNIKYWLRQIPFQLPAGVVYKCDFLIVHNDNHIDLIDVKGWDTPVSKLKRKMVGELYPVKIQVVK